MYTHMFVGIYEFFGCVYIHKDTYIKLKVFHVGITFGRGVYNSKRCFIAVLLSAVVLLYLETEFLSTHAAGKAWTGDVLDFQFCFAKVPFGLSAHERCYRVQRVNAKSDNYCGCLLVKQLYRGKLVF